MSVAMEKDETNNKAAPAETLVKDGYKKTKLGWIPEEWLFVKSSEGISYLGGAAFKSTDKREKGIKWFKIANVGINRTKWDDVSFLPVEFKVKYSDYLLGAGDVVMALTRPVLSGELKITRLTDYDGESLLNQRVARLQVNSKSDKTFCFYFLQMPYFAHEMNNAMAGTDPPNIGIGDLKQIKIPLPPLPEQKKIAAILSTWNKAITDQEQLITEKKLLKKGLMQQLLTAKKRLLDDNEKPFSGEWNTFELGLVIQRFNGKFNPNKETEDFRCIELEHINQMSGTINGYVMAKEQKSIKTRFHKGQVLFGKLRPYLKKYWKVDFDGVCSTEIWVLESIDALMISEYIFYFIQQHKFIQSANATSGSKMPRADWNYMKNIPFEIPHVKEQLKIAKVLSVADQELETLTLQLTALKEQKKGLMQKLLTGEVRVKL